MQAAARRAEAFLSEMRAHGGLLIERGQNAFGFRHLTFQEYFAGRALTHLPAEERVREAAAQALAPLAPSDPDLRLALMARVQSREWYGRPSDFYALRELVAADPEVRQLLAERLADTHGIVLIAVAEVLGDLTWSDPSLRETLLDHFADGGSYVRTMVVETLGRLAPSEPAIRQLCVMSLADESAEVRLAAATALRALVPSDPAIRQSFAERLADTDTAVSALLLEILVPLADTDPQLRARLRQLQTHRRWQARRELVPYLADPDALHACAGRTSCAESSAAQATIVTVLGSLAASHASAHAAVQAHLADEVWSIRSDAEIGEQIVQALAEVVPYDREIRALFVASLNHPAQEMRKQAAEGLAPLISSDPSLYARLLPAVGCAVCYGEDTGRHAPLLPRLATAYGQAIRVDGERRAEVISMLSDEDWRRRKVAAVILHEAGLEAVTEALPQLLAAVSDTRGYDSWPARVAAAERLLNSDRYGEEALNLVQEALTYDADALFPARDADEVRQQAALALGKLKALHRRADVAARIVGLLETEQEPEVLDGLFAALGSLAAAPEPL